MALLLFIFWAPWASAFKLDLSYPESVNEDTGTLSIAISLRAENGDVGSCEISGQIFEADAHSSNPAKLGKDFEIINQGNFDLFIEGAQPERVSSGIEDKSLTGSSDTVELVITQDDISEPTERIHLHTKILQNIGCKIRTNRVDIDINDDDFPGNIKFEKDSYTVNEKDGSVILKLSRLNGSTGSLIATLSTKSGEAKDSEDYTGIAEKKIEFKEGVTSKDVTVTINRDDEVETNESFTVEISDSNDGQSFTKITIIDFSPGKASFSSEAYSGKEGGAVEVSVTREQGSDGELSIEIAVGAEGDTATVGKDYTPPESTRLTWVEGESGTKTISVSLLADEVKDVDERISLRLLQDGEVIDEAILTIEDNTINSGVVSFVHKTFNGEEGGLAEIKVMREQGSDGEFSVELEVGAEGDTATAGKDYTKPESPLLTWAAGDNEPKIISISVLKDDVIDVDEQVSLRLLQEGEVLDSATLTIKDRTDLGVVSFTSKTFSGEEGGAAEIQVMREQGSDGELSVNLRMGTDGDTAVAGEDYTLPDNTQLTWAAGDSETKTISIPLLTDKAEEGDEQASLRLFQGEEELDNAILTIKDTTVLPESGAIIDRVEVTGDHQWGKPQLPLSPFVIKVLDAEDKPIPGLSVSWSVNPGNGGALSEGETTKTDIQGESQNTFTVSIPERVVVTATISQQSNIARQRGINQQPRAEGDLTETFIVNGDIADTEELDQNERSVAIAVDGACSSLENKSNLTDLNEAEKDLLATCKDLKIDNPAAVAEGLKLLAPDEVISQGTAVIEASNLQVMNINSRLIAVRAGATGFVLSGLNIRIEDQTLPGYVINALVKGQTKGGAAGDVPGIAGRWGGFINGNISFGDKDDSDNETGFEFDSQGITIGADYRLSSQAVIGGAMGITRNKSEFNGNAGKMDMDGAHLTAYGTYYQNERFYLDGLIKIGSNNYDTRRRVSRTGDLLQQAMGDTDGQEYSLSLSGGYKNNYGALSYGPYGRLSYTQAEIDAYTESASDPTVKGSGSVLSISDQDVDSLTAVVGGQLSYAISKPSGVYLPQARFEWEHQFSDDSRTLSAQFVHDPNSSVFGISTDNPDRDYFNLGLGMTMVIAGGKSGFVFYETRLDQENLTQHWIKGGFRIEFR
jgi:outer membrane autotransporter protein